MIARTRRLLAIGSLVAVSAVLTACTGVPTSSAPQVVQPVAVQPGPPAVIAPQPGDDQRAIVRGFLSNNASDDQHHSGARAFLTPEEKNRWSDSTQTTVVDSTQIGNPVDNSVTVSGHTIGTIDQNGSYTPSLPGDGTGVGGTPFTLTIGLKQVDGQWRIDTLQNGLVITASQFAQFSPRVVYFYDQTEKQIVPDLRYSTLTDPTLLAMWLMTQLVGQSTSPLSTALPSIPNANQIKVSLGSVLRVDLPGAGQLDSVTRNRMATQIALTLGQVSPGVQMEITDAGKAVEIPQVGGSEFDEAEFDDALAPVDSHPPLYFIYKGGVVDARAHPLPGPIGDGSYGLVSVALAKAIRTSATLVAGTAGSPTSSKLLIGQTDGHLKPATVQVKGTSRPLAGALSRPAWAPHYDEVWVGDGATLYRVTSEGRASAVQIAARSGSVSGQILALRFSPEGARVALVIKSDGASQIWIGSVIRSTGSVRVSGLYAISPLGVEVTDVAWNDQRTLFAIGRDRANNSGSLFEVKCDGSQWTSRGIGNLPPDPDSITVAEGVVAAVSAGGTVWVQHAGTWSSPTDGTTYGSNPIYLE